MHNDTLAGALPWMLFVFGLLAGTAAASVFWRQAARRAQAEALARELMAQLDRMALVVHRTSNAVVITNAQRRITWVNEGFERITGYRASEVIGRSPASLLQFEGTDRQTLARLRQALDAGEGFHGELLNRGKTGREYWLGIEIQPLHSPEGALSGFMAIESDITERKRTEAELKANQASLHNTGRVAGVGGWEYDLAGQQLHWSDQAAALLGMEPGAEPTLDTVLLHFGPEARELIDKAITAGFDGAMAWDSELAARTEDGRAIWVRVAAEGLFADDGAVRIVGAIQDITELVRATRAAEAASVAKSEFLANISHELRTPLQSVIGFSELGRAKAGAQPQLQRMFNEIHAGGGRMLHLVNALLDVAHIDGASGALQRLPCDLGVLAREVVQVLQPQAEQAQVRLAGADQLPELLVQGDPLRLQQVLRQVLLNALRVAPAGSAITLDADAADSQWAVLQVRDSGPGIAADELETIFNAFVQSTRTRDGSGGVGLGLTVCRKIMAALGGSITASSAPGEGAVLRISLPRAASAVLESPAQPEVDASTKLEVA
jgi:PAS domain S-box-containing protein